jgi:P27 family predicted phage terminase small subunit
MAGVKGRSGRKRTPQAVHALRETPVQAPVDTRIPDPPSYLSEQGRREWGRAVQVVREAGCVQAGDAAMAMFCEQFVIWRQATEHLHAHGLVLVKETGIPMANPSVAIAAAAHDRMERILKALGKRAAQQPATVPMATNRFALIRGGGAPG